LATTSIRSGSCRLVVDEGSTVKLQRGALFLAALVILTSIVVILSPSESNNPIISEDEFTLSDNVDPHVQALVDVILSNGDVDDVLAWPSLRLISQNYSGAMLSPGAVLAGQMGSDLDRCRVVREMLTAVDIPSRYALSDESCWIEAKKDEVHIWVATSVFDSVSSLEMNDLTYGFELPSNLMHMFALIEETNSTTGNGNYTLIEGPLPDLSRGPISAEYVEVDGELRLSVSIGQGENAIVVQGEDVSNTTRHNLVFRHIWPDGTTTDNRRTLFNEITNVGNQAPNQGTDTYGIWIGAHIVGQPYLAVEHGRLIQNSSEDNLGEALYYRAAELAMQTDYSAYLLFEENDIDGAFVYDELRIVISALETRTEGMIGSTPSFDLLSNVRSILGPGDSPSLQIALGWSDALTESALIQQITGTPALTTPAVFETLFREEPAGISSRMQAMDSALNRLESEGVTEEGLIFLDPISEQRVEVTKISTDLILLLNDTQMANLSAATGDNLGEMSFASGGIILESGEGRSWPIELLLLEQGAAMDYSLRIQHIESAQGSLLTPEGTTMTGTGSYNGENMTFTGLVRTFEEIPDGETTPHDRADWYLHNSTGGLVGSEDTEMDYETPSLTETNIHAKLLVLGSDQPSTGWYQSPFWLHPVYAENIRAGNSTQLRFSTYASTVTLDVFENGTSTVDIDGNPVDIRTITARNTAGEYAVTIAKEGTSRVILGMETPVSDSVVTSLQTPNELRLRGRVVSEDFSFQAGLENAEIYSTERIGQAWPDGSVDIRVPGTAQATLDGSVAILFDSSKSMYDDNADPDCTGNECPNKLSVVGDAIETIAYEAPSGVEFAVWHFENFHGGNDTPCLSDDENIREMSDWTLSRHDTAAAKGSLAGVFWTYNTPLTGAVSAAISNFERGTWGHEQRLIVLADGDNDCSEGLDTLVVPSGLEIHTIGIGINQGSNAELELEALANRTGGTYTRTSNATELSNTLTALAIAPIPELPPESIEVEVRAQGYVSSVVSFPVNQDNITIVLESEEGRDAPSLIAVMPGDALPTLQDTATIALINERRAARPNHVFVMPNQEVDAGGSPLSYAWLEIDMDTGHTAALTHDGLHGAAIFYHGAHILGLWTGTDAVIGNFGGCVLLPDGCGENIEEISETLCDTSSTESEDVLEILHLIGEIFESVDGDQLESRFNDGMEMVHALCMGEPYFADYVADQIGGGIKDQFGEGAGQAWEFFYNTLSG